MCNLAALALPAEVCDDIAAFCAAGKTGQIVLHVKEGTVMQMDSNAIQKVRGPKKELEHRLPPAV